MKTILFVVTMFLLLTSVGAYAGSALDTGEQVIESPSTEPGPKPESPAPDADPFGTPATDSKPAPADDPFAPAPDAKEAEDEPAEPSAPTDAEALPSPDEPAQPVQPLGPRNFAQVTPAEVAGAMQATMTAGRQMAAAEDAGDAAQLDKARANFYVSLFDMANAITLGQLGPAGSQLDPRALEPMIGMCWRCTRTRPLSAGRSILYSTTGSRISTIPPTLSGTVRWPGAITTKTAFWIWRCPA